MVQTIQLQNVNLRDLIDKFGIQFVQELQFFPKWQENLPELTDSEKQQLDKVKAATDWDLQDIRSGINPKETYFIPLSQQRNFLNKPGEGRKTLAEAAAKIYDRIRKLCSEDIVNLEPPN